MATWHCREHCCDDTETKGVIHMSRLRRVVAWLLVSVVVLSLVATLVVEGAS
jgi:hypothetical protein